MNIGIQWLLGASEILSYFGNLGHISHLSVPCTYLLRIQQRSHSKILAANDACSKLTANPSRTTYLQDWRVDRQKKRDSFHAIPAAAYRYWAISSPIGKCSGLWMANSLDEQANESQRARSLALSC